MIKRAVLASDVRRLGGVVSVQPMRSRTESDVFFQVVHVSCGGSAAFRSAPIGDPDQADAAARVVAELVGAVVDRR
jgi:hypothetical protein